MTPAIGRDFTEEEDEIGRERVVLLSDGLWRRRFGGDPSVVGRTIDLSGVPFAVVGVMGPDFQFPGREFQIWMPLTINPAEMARKVPGYSCLAVARLKAGVDLEEAQRRDGRDRGAPGRAHPATSRRRRARDAAARGPAANVRSALYVLFGAVPCLLLVACLNLVDAAGGACGGRAARARRAPGAGCVAGRVALQSIAELVPLLVLGGALGVALAVWAVSAFVPLAPPTLPRVESIQVSVAVRWRSSAFVMLTRRARQRPAGGAGLAIGSRPPRLRDEPRALRQRGVSRARAASLVVAQIALALPLLVGAVLLARTFSRAAADPGLRTRQRALAAPRDSAIQVPRRWAVARVFGRIARAGARRCPASARRGWSTACRSPAARSAVLFEFDAPPRCRRSPTVRYARRDPGLLHDDGDSADRRPHLQRARYGPSAPVGIVDERVASDVAGPERHRPALPPGAALMNDAALDRDRRRRRAHPARRARRRSAAAGLLELSAARDGPHGAGRARRADAAALTASVRGRHPRDRSRAAGLRRPHDGRM